MKITSHSFVKKDFRTDWYKKWAKLLKQDEQNLEDHDIYANKFWQNSIMVEALSERGVLGKGSKGIGFGVGRERLPALFASMGVNITATDQDFKTKKAGYWSEHELALGAKSLNSLGICSKESFSKHVEYMAVDMTSIPDKLDHLYDFLWSNCALGHLGSIPAGKKFIENSLGCLKPGGYAVHTTELNILSDKHTVFGGSTVVFRLRDVFKLQLSLLSKGYVCDAFSLDMGSLPEDRDISINPKFGNGYSKIQIMGSLATQVLLIVSRPKDRLNMVTKAAKASLYAYYYARNLLVMAWYRSADINIKSILASQTCRAEDIKITPTKKVVDVVLKRGGSKEVYLEYANSSSVPIFSAYSRLSGSKPVVLATYNPKDRESSFYDKDTWMSKTRGDYRHLVAVGPRLEESNYILPGQNFVIPLTINSSVLAKGTYVEEFCLVQEGVSWIDGSTETISITVT
jgi:hypothetical protein